ncbi:MAG: competence/damage-inducible protein A [Chthoniobacterales bacterium]
MLPRCDDYVVTSSMRVVVINTGTEILLGDVLNTHLTFIAREIFPLGLRVSRQVTVPDGSAIQEALADACRHAEIIFVTGGLGPTTDDLTRESAAEMLGLPLRRDAELAAAITDRLKTRGFPMTDRILRQADVPEAATVLPNDNGTAPGLYLPAQAGEASATPHLFLLPGPPRELKPMWRESVLPILRQIVPSGGAVGCRTFKLACVGESMVEAAVGPRLLALPNVELGYCARAGEVDVRVLGPHPTLEAAEAIIRSAFPVSLYSASEEDLPEVVVRLLTGRNETLVTAESCTGGYLAHRLTNVPGASAVFLGGHVTYSNQLKAESLKVDPALIQEHGAVSKAVAAQMAAGALGKTGATYALATTGIAGPGGGSAEKPVGTVLIALATVTGHNEVQHRRFQTDRETFKHLTTQTALEMLRQRLL